MTDDDQKLIWEALKGNPRQVIMNLKQFENKFHNMTRNQVEILESCSLDEDESIAARQWLDDDTSTYRLINS